MLLSYQTRMIRRREVEVGKEREVEVEQMEIGFRQKKRLTLEGMSLGRCY